MKYLSVFASTGFVWMAMIGIAGFRQDSEQAFWLYLATIVYTLVVFVIGFGQSK